MLFNITLKANEQRELNGTGQYFNLLSSSAGKVRIRALDSDAREIISTDILNGDAIEFERLVSKLYVTASEDAAAVLYFSQHKLVNNGVKVSAPGNIKSSTAVFAGTKKISTITAQNNEVKVKALTDIRIGGSAQGLNFWNVKAGEIISLETAGEVYASSGLAEIVNYTTATEQGTNVKSGMCNCLAFQDGFFSGTSANVWEYTEYGGATVAKPELNDFVVIRSPAGVNRHFLFKAGAGNLTIVELLNGGGVLTQSITPIDTSFLTTAAALLSQDVQTVLFTAEGIAQPRFTTVDIKTGLIASKLCNEIFTGINKCVGFNDGFIVGAGEGILKLDKALNKIVISQNTASANCITAFDSVVAFTRSGSGNPALISFDGAQTFQALPSSFDGSEMVFINSKYLLSISLDKIRIYNTDTRQVVETTTPYNQIGIGLGLALQQKNNDLLVSVLHDALSATGRASVYKVAEVNGSITLSQVEVLELF